MPLVMIPDGRFVCSHCHGEDATRWRSHCRRCEGTGIEPCDLPGCDVYASVEDAHGVGWCEEHGKAEQEWPDEATLREAPLSMVELVGGRS